MVKLPLVKALLEFLTNFIKITFEIRLKEPLKNFDELIAK